MFSDQICSTCQTANNFNPCCLSNRYYQQQTQPNYWQSDQFSYSQQAKNNLQSDSLLRQSLQTQVNYFPPTQLLPSFDDLIGQIPTSLSVDNQSHIFLEDNNSIQEFEDWTSLHPDFGKENPYKDKTYQQLWKEQGLSFKEALEWIEAGFLPNCYEQIEQWKIQKFIPIQVRAWISVGLNLCDHELATYLRNNGYSSENAFLSKSIAQHWLDWQYPEKGASKRKKNNGEKYKNYKRKRNEITDLDISRQSLSDNLKLTKFDNLVKLDCPWNGLTSLNLSCCQNLKIINCSNNLLTDLKLPKKGEKITYLDIKNNNFAEQDLTRFSQLFNCQKLSIGYSSKISALPFEDILERRDNYNKFTNSLEYLQNCSLLELLDVSNTDIDSDLEYLPKSLRYFYCSTDHRSKAKCQTIYNLFVNQQGEVEIEKDGYILNFPQKLHDYKQWRKLNFAEKEIKEWIIVSLTLDNYDLANYLKNERSLTSQEAKDKLTELSNEYLWWKKGFILEQKEQWITAGAKVDDHDFVAWFRDVKKIGPEWITNYQEDYQMLSDRFKQYGLCSDCQQPNTGEKWCKECNIKNSASRISTLNQSGNAQVDNFIQDLQLDATEANKFIEWIPYEQFMVDPEPIGQGGFGKVYKAQWKEGSVQHWNKENKQWKREKDENRNYREVVLKALANSQNNTDFLEEAAKHKIIDDWFNNIVPCYGLSQDPETGNYLLVMQYLPERDLRNYLKRNNDILREEIIQKKEFEQWINELKSEMTLLESKLKCEDQEYLKRKQELTFSLKELIDSNEKEPEVKKVLSKNKIDSLFRNLPIDEEKFLTELDNIKKELSKEITIDNSLISQETSELLKKIKTELDSVREKTNEYQKFEEEKIKKEQELSKFKDFIYANKELDTVDLSQIIELLKKQELLTKNKNEESAKELEISKRKTKRLNKISDEEINQLCQLQSEITQIELQLNKKLEQSTKQLTKVVNNITNNYGTIFKNSNLEINGGQNLLGGDNKIISQKRTKRDSWEQGNTKKMNVQEQNNASEQYNLDSHNQDITQVHDKITNTEEMKNPFKKKQPNTMINNDSDEEMGEASSTNQPSTTTVGRSVNTKEGNTNLANQAGKHADFSSNRRRSTSNGANFSGSGTFNFTGGQNIMGGNNSDVSQVNYNTDPNVEVKRLLDRAYNKLDDDDQELLDDVLIAVRDHAEKQTNWKNDRELSKNIRFLANKLKDDLTRGEIESICQHEFEAEEKRLEVKREKEIKQLIIAQIQQANGS